MYSVSPVGFDKQMGRDNKMFFINEGNNLNEKEVSFLDKFVQLDMLPSKLKLKSFLVSDGSNHRDNSSAVGDINMNA